MIFQSTLSFTRGKKMNKTNEFFKRSTGNVTPNVSEDLFIGDIKFWNDRLNSDTFIVCQRFELWPVAYLFPLSFEREQPPARISTEKTLLNKISRYLYTCYRLNKESRGGGGIKPNFPASKAIAHPFRYVKNYLNSETIQLYSCALFMKRYSKRLVTFTFNTKSI